MTVPKSRPGESVLPCCEEFHLVSQAGHQGKGRGAASPTVPVRVTSDTRSSCKSFKAGHQKDAYKTE